MKKLIAMVLLAAALLSLGAVFADNYYYYRVVGNDGDVQYLAYLGDNVWVNANGNRFRWTGITGEYLSDCNCYFHDSNYVRGTGTETMPGQEYFAVTGNDGDVQYISYCGSDVWLNGNGVAFYMTGVKGEYVSQYGYYFHAANYVRGTGHEYMPLG